MGRSFESVRQGVKSIADRWSRTSRALKKEDQKYGEKIVEFTKKHSSMSFVGCDDPLEAAVFSVLVEILKHQEEEGCSNEILNDEHPKDGVLSSKYWT
jgi:hypothetical protein